MDFTVPAIHRVKIEESEKLEKIYWLGQKAKK